MSEPDTYSVWIDCAACGVETEFALTKREAAFYEALHPVQFSCPECGCRTPASISRQAPIIDAELLEEWLLDERLAFDEDEDQSLAFVDADTLILYASRPDARPSARRTLAFGLVEKLTLDAFETPSERILARSFLTERLKLWAAPEPSDAGPRTARRRAALSALYAR